ncbi:hypothetical protein Cgig2_028166 [Carnegiea gigantea]|uniref:Transposase, Ptta/En/Spm, plant n=1 Tax=Carnegiea gigantea TaxID=171969 RepID=A0A9Q1GVR9_9CARY|nr:hypothetical protein Cgig2_028166 [Carnegiea gigantea]
MESYREHVLLHMYDLWTNWRSDLKRYNITKRKRTLRQALDHVPSGLQKEEWHWLITEIYSKDPHKCQNFANRANYKKERLHRIGSKPFRQVAWELVAKKVFKSKSRDSVVGYGGGVKAKDIRGPSRTRWNSMLLGKKNEVLVDRVTTVETENESLRNRVEAVEAEMGKFKDWVSKQLNINIPSYANTENGNPG